VFVASPYRLKHSKEGKRHKFLLIFLKGRLSTSTDYERRLGQFRGGTFRAVIEIFVPGETGY
jgi:hypothetical protein